MIQVTAGAPTLEESIDLIVAVETRMGMTLAAKYGENAQIYVEGTVGKDGYPVLTTLRPIL